MTTRDPLVSSAARILLASAALALVASCTEPVATDYREKYQLSAYPTMVVLGIHVAGGRIAFANDEEARFKALEAGYLDRGHGPVMLTAPRAARAGLAAVRTRLIADGVPSGDIRIGLTEQGSPDVVAMSYERYEALVPTCGDWTSVPSYDPYNEVSSNFGCALQHDIGLMAADPADLVRARATAPTNGQTASRVIQRYRAGTPTWAVPNPPQAYGNSENTSGGQ